MESKARRVHLAMSHVFIANSTSNDGQIGFPGVWVGVLRFRDGYDMAIDVLVSLTTAEMKSTLLS